MHTWLLASPEGLDYTNHLLANSNHLNKGLKHSIFDMVQQKLLWPAHLCPINYSDLNKAFLECNGIRHITMSLYSPVSNSRAASAVQSIMDGIKTMKAGSLNMKKQRSEISRQALFNLLTTGNSPTGLEKIFRHTQTWCIHTAQKQNHMKKKEKSTAMMPMSRTRVTWSSM